MPFRVSFLFQQSTIPEDPAQAGTRTAGWSEGVWQQDNTNLQIKIQRLARARCQLLGRQAQIIGYRVQQYALQGIKMVPGGSSSVRQRYPGNNGFECDQPQVSLRLLMPTQNAINKATFTLRGIPDNQVHFGEANLIPQFKGSLTQWANLLVADGWCTVGRNLTGASQPILSIVGNVLTTTNQIPGVIAGTSYLQLLKVKDNNGHSVTGAYLVTAVNNASYTLAGYTAGANVGMSGTARIATLIMLPIAQQLPDERSYLAVVKKVGRPFAAYRGRGSRKKTAA